MCVPPPSQLHLPTKGAAFSGMFPHTPPLPSSQNTSYWHFYFRHVGAHCLPSWNASLWRARMTWLVCCCPQLLDHTHFCCCPCSTCSVRSASACGWTGSALAHSAALLPWIPCDAGRMGPRLHTCRCTKLNTSISRCQRAWHC